MNSDDITESVDEWEVLKLGGIDHELGILPSFLLSELRWINNFHGADEHLVRDSSGLRFDGLFVWERGINDDTIEVAKVEGASADLGEFSVVVLKEIRLESGMGFNLLFLQIWWRTSLG